jgi:RNA polymerase sigma factor for flagellar operon FliA
LDARQFAHARAGAATVVLSLEAPASSGSGDDDEMAGALVDTIASHAAPDPARCAEDGELHEALVVGIRALTERERILLSLYYERELTMKEISHVLGVSEARVCQLHSRALQRLRANLADLSTAA